MKTKQSNSVFYSARRLNGPQKHPESLDNIKNTAIIIGLQSKIKNSVLL
ncbi:hypothetical protein VHA_001232 [Grimontia hollisae CIP 101886]|uniref:Uncharacterized protein n=1 Tax=Grimontia hollisae CIP 101886 TaxID=675812 RepID=D0I665_GRIHO|nr:hypothetical protein VHA_001232 [Grimontia hollisae CIP 101886]